MAKVKKPKKVQKEKIVEVPKPIVMVSVVVVSLEGSLEIRRIESNLLNEGLTEFDSKKYIHFTLDNTGTAGTNPMIINLLIQTVGV